ncbi:hypothetical protein PR048_019086 [Dryococelus australis]|uniref:Uncharacterized protein n=1 Tax=Dryococelus australis TaxID=614101 RepID=A0ABQ9H2K2_9NEOP|nr:hypothetical protein PR048_019086 [Dryococelus australis]
MSRYRGHEERRVAGAVFARSRTRYTLCSAPAHLQRSQHELIIIARTSSPNSAVNTPDSRARVAATPLRSGEGLGKTYATVADDKYVFPLIGLGLERVGCLLVREDRGDGGGGQNCATRPQMPVIALGSRKKKAGGRGDVVVSPSASHPGGPVRLPVELPPDFRMWESCWTMPLVGGSSRISPVFPPFRSGAAPFSPQYTRVGPQDLDVKSRIQQTSNKASIHFVSVLTRVNIHDRCPRKKLYVPENNCTKHLQFAKEYMDKPIDTIFFPHDVLLMSVSKLTKRLVRFSSLNHSFRVGGGGGTVAERLTCSPPTKAFRVQSPAGSLRMLARGNRAGRCRWSAGFLGNLPFPLSYHSGTALYSPQSITLIGSQDQDVKSRPNLFTHSLGMHRINKIPSDRRRAARKVTSGKEICDCEYQAVKSATGRLDYRTRFVPCTRADDETRVIEYPGTRKVGYGYPKPPVLGYPLRIMRVVDVALGNRIFFCVLSSVMNCRWDRCNQCLFPVKLGEALLAVRPVIRSLLDKHLCSNVKDSDTAATFKISISVPFFSLFQIDDLGAEDETAAVAIRQYVRQVVFGIPHVQWKTSLVTTLLLATPKQRSDGTSQVEHYLREPQVGYYVDPREVWKGREKSYYVLALSPPLYFGSFPRCVISMNRREGAIMRAASNGRVRARRVICVYDCLWRRPVAVCGDMRWHFGGRKRFDWHAMTFRGQKPRNENGLRPILVFTACAAAGGAPGRKMFDRGKLQICSACVVMDMLVISVRFLAGALPDFLMWESCRTMLLVGGFPRGSPVPPPFHSGAAPYSTRFTPIGSQDLDVGLRNNTQQYRIYRKKTLPSSLLKVEVKQLPMEHCTRLYNLKNSLKKSSTDTMNCQKKTSRVIVMSPHTTGNRKALCKRPARHIGTSAWLGHVCQPAEVTRGLCVGVTRAHASHQGDTGSVPCTIVPDLCVGKTWLFSLRVFQFPPSHHFVVASCSRPLGREISAADLMNAPGKIRGELWLVLAVEADV